MAKRENQVYNAIMDYLRVQEHLYKGRAFFFRNNNGPVYDTARKAFRRMHKDTPSGLPDILGVMDGHFIGIEVKTSKGKQSPSQKAIEDIITQAGGTYLLARSIEDVEHLFPS